MFEEESVIGFRQDSFEDSFEVFDFDLDSFLKSLETDGEGESIFEDFYKPKVLEGKVLVTRSPCHFPSDLQGFKAVDNV